ncbi:MAG: FtsX-like permease family protein [Dehalococcoidia bacterium]|nr:FtsX-like permease family protein [Dehalococcoidia bacterium]
MNELFGVSMNLIAAVCVAATALILAAVAFIAWRNPVMFKMGLRNIPRRKAQTALIIVGLMLSTLIMSAAFGTGDTLTTSVTAEVYSILGEADEWVSWDAEKEPRPLEEQVIPLETVEQWQAKFAGDPDIEAIVPFQRESLPVLNTRTKLNEPSARIVGFRAKDAASLGGLKDSAGRPVTLAGNEIAINEDLAGEIDGKPGDVLLVYYKAEPIEFVVKAVVPSGVLSGAIDPSAASGAAVDFETIANLTGRGQNADAVIVSNTGGVKTGLARSDIAVEKLEAELEGTPYTVSALKKELVNFAELIGSAFTTIFVVFGLFSIAAGVLLIFLIFVMLAAERKPEMGMARAVGAKRRQLVESFLAEGMGYDLGSAVVGLIAGMGVTYAMVEVIKIFAGDNLGLDLTVTFTGRSLVVAFCLGVIATFLMVFASSWRASRLNITAAIRDLPESHPVNPEASTWKGYYRAALNGIVALALPIGLSLLLVGPVGMVMGLPLALAGLVSPWVFALRGSNTAAPADHRTSEGPPKWPWILGAAIPVVGWVLILAPYWIAVGLVVFFRDRRPATLPPWLGVLSLLVWPVALVTVLLQAWRVRISWAAGVATAFGVAGIALTYGGMDRDSAFFFLLGVSAVALWIAVTLQYFGLSDRFSFSAVSALVLVLWYLPSKWVEPVTGPLNGDIEMFFLSGMVMVTCGTFIIVYNADIILPAIARLGSRFGRIVPALKTGVAYPLTSRFRTGMTIAMIGLIMFSLVMMAAINTNVAAIYLNDDTRGGYDNVIGVNRNNPIEDIRAAISAGGADASAISAVGELRTAAAQEAQVENRDEFKNAENDEGDKIVTEWSRYPVFGADAGFMASNKLTLKFRAEGYASDRDVWAAMGGDASLALIPSSVTVAQQGFGGGPATGDLLRLNPVEDGFAPFTLTLRDPGTGKESKVTVIGQMSDAADTFFQITSPDFSIGILTGKQTVLETFPQSQGQRYYLTLKAGVDSKEYAKSVEAALVQASADSIHQLLDDQQKIQNGFMLVFQGFMGLGLIVGIAALAVIASRAVVERRQQIGMLRAIGYQRGMVALSFLFESGFIALSGIFLGVALGLSLAWVLYVSDDFGDTNGMPFAVPWLNLGIICGIAFVVSMFMTFLPARAASRVPVAEALRYE